LDSDVLIIREVEQCLLAEGVSFLFWGCVVSGKVAVIMVELVDESVGCADGAIAADLFRWFNDEALPAPWVKKVKVVSVQGFSESE
jgi:hypothetical protein